MSRIVFVPDTNFFIYHPDFVSFFDSARITVHLAIVLPVLEELDGKRKARFRKRSADHDAGVAADRAFRLIHRLREEDNPPEDLKLEIIRSDKVDPAHKPDVQIVDYTVLIAREIHPDDSVVFVTNDLHLPSLLFAEEKRRAGLDNLTIKTSDEIREELSSYGNPSATIERVRVNPSPVEVAGKSGMEILVDFSVTDLKGGRASVAAFFFRQSGKVLEGLGPAFRTTTGQLVVYEAFNVNVAHYREQQFTLFLPYQELRPVYGRTGVKHLGLLVTVWDAERWEELARSAYYPFDYALGKHHLPLGRYLLRVDEKRFVSIPETITVRELASLLEISPIDLILKLMSIGVMTNINQILDHGTAAVAASYFGFEILET